MIEVDDSDMDTSGERIGRTRHGALSRLYARIAGWISGWFVRRRTAALMVRVEVMAAKLADEKADRETERRRLRAEIDALTAEKDAMAKLHVSVCAAIDLHTAMSNSSAARFRE